MITTIQEYPKKSFYLSLGYHSYRWNLNGATLSTVSRLLIDQKANAVFAYLFLETGRQDVRKT